jgi:hypothetical protein
MDTHAEMKVHREPAVCNQYLDQVGEVRREIRGHHWLLEDEDIAVADAQARFDLLKEAAPFAYPQT